MDWLGVGFIGHDLGVLAEEFEDSVSSRVPRDLHCKMIKMGERWGTMGKYGEIWGKFEGIHWSS
jgi:hypothetical protein